MEGFKKFLFRGNLVQLAVAVVIGAQFSALVNQFVKSFVDPLLALVGGNQNLSHLKGTIGDTVFPYGDFISASLTFLISAVVVYFVLVAPMAKVISYLDRDQAATEKDCPHCLSQIPLKASRCAHCTQPVPVTA
ncbi:large conductance mechanosensitive channel protein MscL [Actinocorallia populi]|uniref:large conductance mechanosensitive channel protein MscL n=1 Tax=Actinocorallia populi TaxID=2079200 RepID=UPI000D08C58C|nr:large conductance mechanosensitive channel protein MscL [Actinocorallia populi]